MDIENEDDMIVLVVLDENIENFTRQDIKMNSGQIANKNLDEIIETAKKYGHYLLKNEENSQYYDCDSLDENGMNSDWNDNYTEDFDSAQDDCIVKEEYVSDSEDHVESDISGTTQVSNNHRFAMLKPWEQKSFVAELRQSCGYVEGDDNHLVRTLAHIMGSVKPPPPPRDYYIMNGIMFECVECEHLSESIPAAGRHYQDRHGQRYLACYACGVDFRSTTNLYKHEKRCVAPDAGIVLRARAAFLRSKGRSRPYIQNTKSALNKKPTFRCTLCSAVFVTRSNLQSHENLHRGERPYRCDACPRAYTSYSALLRHTKKHTNIQFICDYCNRSFNVKASLVTHMDTHSPLRKHGCDECSRRFSQRASLFLHVSKEHRNLPPPCASKICPKRYPRMSLLNAHMKRAHGLTIIIRKMFFKSLPTMTELEVQQSKLIFKSEDNITREVVPYNIEEMFQKCKEGNVGETVHVDHNKEAKKWMNLCMV